MTRKTDILIALLFLFTSACALQAGQPPAAPHVEPPAAPQKPVSVKISSPDDTAPLTFYRLDFTIRELDHAQLVDTRSYSLSVQSGVAEDMMAGDQVPYPSSVYSGAASTPVKSISYRSVGVSIACTVKEGDDSPRLDLKLEISDALPPAKDSDSPVFRKVSLSSRALLPLGKPTTVGMVEDPGSRHRYQVDVTATKLK